MLRYQESDGSNNAVLKKLKVQHYPRFFLDKMFFSHLFLNPCISTGFTREYYINTAKNHITDINENTLKRDINSSRHKQNINQEIGIRMQIPILNHKRGAGGQGSMSIFSIKIIDNIWTSVTVKPKVSSQKVAFGKYRWINHFKMQ